MNQPQNTSDNTSAADWFGYCADMARANEEDAWLAAGYAPRAMRPALMALIAFQIELRRIPGAVSEPPLGEIRLQWWRDALDEIEAGKAPRAHPVVQGLAATGAASRRDIIDPAIDARGRLFYGEPFASREALEEWLAVAEGFARRLAAEILAPGLAAADAAAVETAGRALDLARFAAALAPHLKDSAQDRARALHKEAAPALRATPPALAPTIAPIALTPVYAKGESPGPLSRRLRLFAAVASGRF